MPDNITIVDGSDEVVIIHDPVGPPGAGGGGGGGAMSISAGVSSASLASMVFSNSNGVSFGLSGSTITGSHNGLTDPTIFRATSQNSQLQFTSANSNFRFTSADSQLQFTSANSNFLGTGATASFRHTSADSQLRFTSADSQLQFTSANSNFLGTAATQSFRHTSADSQLRFTSADSQLQFTSANSDFLGTAATQSFQFTSDNSLSLGTGATASFRHTSADSQLQFTSANSNFLGTAATQSFRHTSADSQLQFTSANSKFAQEWQLTGNSTGTNSSVQGSRLYFSGDNMLTVSGSSNTIAFSVNTASLLGTGATASFRFTSQNSQLRFTSADSQLQFTSDNSLSLGTGATASFRHTSADTQLQFTSANSKFAQSWELEGNQTAGTTGSSQGSILYFSGGNMMTLSGNSNTIVFSMNSASLLGTGATASFRHTSADTQLRFTSADTQLRFTSADSQLRFTSADSQLRFTSQDSQLRFTSNAIGAVGISTAGNTAGTTGSEIGTYWFQGGNNVTLSQITSNNGSHTLIFSAAAAAPSPTAISAGTSSGSLSSIVFADSNQFSWGLNGSTMTGSIPGTSSLSATGGVSIATNGSTVSIGMPAFDLNFSGGNSSGNTFSASSGTVAIYGGNNITLSLDSANSKVSISGPNPATLSHWANMPLMANMVTGASAITQTSGSSIFIQPITVPANVSMNFVRFLASFNDSAVGTAGTTSANTTFSIERYTTFGLMFFTQGVGANSRSLQLYTSTSQGMTGRTQFSMAGVASSYTIGISKTYPATGANQNYGTTYNVNSASIVLSSNSNTLFTGPRFLDIAFAASLSPGNYWVGLGASTSSSSNSSNISFLGTAALAMSIAGVSNSNVSAGVLGAVTSASDHQLYGGLGMWSTNASRYTTDSIGMNSISQVVSNPMMPIQMIRSA